jgi:hypothetical protein
VANSKLTMKGLEALGLSLSQLQTFVKDVERARVQIAATRAGSSTAPPTFADFLKEMEGAQTAGQKAVTGTGAPAGSGTGNGAIRGVTEGMKETVDLEYQDLLEEYYRSLADPAWRRGKK